MRNSRLAAWVALPVLVVMLGFLFVLATSDGGDSDDSPSPLIGFPAPGIVGETIDGESFDLEELDGQFVVVNFFATWCIPCVREHPELVNFERRHAVAGDAAVVSVVYDAKVDTVREFFTENGGEWPVVTDPDGRTALEYALTGVPESFLVDPDGVVVWHSRSGVSASGLDQVLRSAQDARA